MKLLFCLYCGYDGTTAGHSIDCPISRHYYGQLHRPFTRTESRKDKPMIACPVCGENADWQDGYYCKNEDCPNFVGTNNEKD